jgi:hypothetical protein
MEFPQYYQMMLSMVDKIPREYYGSSDGGMFTDPHDFADVVKMGSKVLVGLGALWQETILEICVIF